MRRHRRRLLLQRRLASKAARCARRMARAAAALACLDARLAAVGAGDDNDWEEEGHRAVQFGWRSENAGFEGIALYGEAVAACAEALPSSA